MAVDMKEIIAQETKKLLFDKKVKKLTVKDIVDACHITRQAFYYHFADIPELIKWMLEQLRRFFTTAVNARSVIKKGLESNYGKEAEKLLIQNMQALIRRVAEKQGRFKAVHP